MSAGSVLTGSYDYRLVALSVFISILAGYAALDLAERIDSANGWMRPTWLYAGATAMGIGVWAMHYVGMVAFQLPVSVQYDWPTVLLSLFTAIFAAGLALFLVSRPTMGLRVTAAGSLFMGAGIAGMHYIGMEAMRFPAMCVYSPGVVVLSVVLAIVISFVALQLAFARKSELGHWGWRKVLSGLILGLAIPAMHYVGVAAVTIVPDATLNAGLQHAYSITPFSLAVISIATLVILSHVCIISSVNRRFALQGKLLAQSEMRLRTTFDKLTEGIVVFDMERNIIHINSAANRILGLTTESIPFNAVRDEFELLTLSGELLPPEQWPSARALRGDFVENYEVEIRSDPSNKGTIVEVRTAPVNNKFGATVQVILTLREISDRKRLDEARGHLAAIVESSRDAIIGKDLQGTVTSWNKGAEQIFGYAAQEMIGQPVSRLLPPGHEDDEAGILEKLRQGETIEQLETVRRRKDGRLIQVSLMISPIRDARGKIVGASKIARDITEKKLLERQLRQSQKMEAIGQLTGGIAHDFNNLLGIVIGNLDLLERQVAGNDAALRRVQVAQKAAARGADLTRRLLSLASNMELNPAPLKLDDAIREMVELASRALGPEIKIQTSFDSALPAVYADAGGLESALLNLAVNARDAMPRGGSLTLTTRLANLDASYPAVHTGDLAADSYACVSVTDTGHGMSQETQERAFEPFFTTKSREKGTGLGLAMVYAFAKNSGGTARIYSEQGYGTTVSIYLPLADTPSQPATEQQETHGETTLSGTVLVVDDEADLLEIANAYLTDMGYTVIQAGNGASALEAVARLGHIDLIVTDVIMPGGMNGMELAQRVLQLSPDTRVIFSSGFPADALEEKSGRPVEGPILRKPYQRAEFNALVQRTMREAVLNRGRNPPFNAGTDI